MMTQTHCLIAATLLAKPERPRVQNMAIVLGSLTPDLAIFGLFILSKFQGWSEQKLWSEIYFSEPMLTLTTIFNSLPLYSILLLCCILMLGANGKPITQGWFQKSDVGPFGNSSLTLGLFALAAITHLLGDFPVHVNDAHPHFWPFSDWRFQSPISYWDDRYHGKLFSFIEAVLGVVMSVFIFRRFNNKFVRSLTVFGICAYVFVHLYFSLVL